MLYDNKSPFDLEHFKLTATNLTQISEFESKAEEGKGLEIYLKNYAEIDEEKHMARTYLVKSRTSNDLAGFFSLRSGAVVSNEKRRLIRQNEFDFIPGVEIANFAVNNNYVKKHDIKGKVGAIIMLRHIFPKIVEISEEVGVAMAYIFALPEENLLKYYEDSYGFMRLPKKQERQMHARIKPRYDEGCIFMYLPIKDIVRAIKGIS